MALATDLLGFAFALLGAFMLVITFVGNAVGSVTGSKSRYVLAVLCLILGAMLIFWA